MTTETEDTQRLLEELGHCEAGVWDALVSGNRQADDAALADSFLGVYPDGFALKADHVQQLAKGATVQSYVLSRSRVMPLGAEHALLSYRAEFLRVGRSSKEAMYVSSIWQRQAEGWVNIFSQDTPAID